MAKYEKILRVTDLQELSKTLADSQILLAYNKKNWKTPMSLINQKKIINAIQNISDKDGEISTINLTMKDGSIVRLGVYNGPTGDKGKIGDQGERGDKGDTALLDDKRSDKWLLIVNDNETADSSKVWSANQGVIMNNDIENLSETFMSDDKYQLLFRDLVFMNAEFISEEENENVLLFNSDPVEHKIYVKYWTYESDGSSEYFVLNDFGNTYDSVSIDLWEDIYLGNTSGYFNATSAQLIDGNTLYVLNNGVYDNVSIDDSGNRTFKYWLENIECYVNVVYNKTTNSYDYSLDATELPLNVYQQISGGVYTRIINKSDIDTSGLTFYYTKVGDSYEYINDIESFLQKKAIRYYKLGDANQWVEQESLEDINTSSFEEYIVVDYSKATNTNIFTKYIYVKTIRDEYYSTKVDTLNNYSIKYYIYDENREYFTRRLVENEGVWEYEYTKINIPFWVDAEYITEEEDQTILLLNSDVEKSEIESVDPVYLSSIEFEESDIVISKNSVDNINLTFHPSNVNVTDMIMTYDDSIITLYEDGRIAAIETDEITLNTQIKVCSKHNTSVSDTLNVTVVTPIEEIVPNTTQINLYPGDSFKLEYTTVPEIVSDNSVTWTPSVKDMLNISDDGIITLKQQADGSYKTGTCNLVGVANDGFGGIIEIPVLVAIPCESINITSKNFGFIDVKDKLVAEVLPENATEKSLKYYSSNSDIISINELTGEYTPKSAGVATLSAVTTDGTELKDEIDVTVTIGVSEIIIEGIDETLDVGLTNNFTITVLPEEANNLGIIFNVSDKSVIDYIEPKLIDGYNNKYEGSLTAIKGGTTNIAVIALDGSNIYDEHDLMISIPVSDITFEQTEVNIFTGAVITISAIIGPNDATVKDIIWHSSNEKVATVDTYGRVQGISDGKTIISARSGDNNSVMASCIVNVNVPVETIELDNKAETLTILKDSTEYIDAIVTPNSATNQILSWTSSDPEIVSVTENDGIIYGNKIGNAIITAFTTDGTNISTSISVNVVEEFPSEEIDNIEE